MQPGPSLIETLLRQNTLPAAEIDAETGLITRTNRALAAMVDLRIEEIRGAPLDSFLDEGIREQWASLCAAPGTGQCLETSVLRHRNTRRSVKISVHPGSGPRGRTLLAVVEPVALQRPLATPGPLSSDECATPNDHANIFRHIVLNANEGIWTVDEHSRTTFVNKRMAEMLGYEPDEMRGRLISDFVPPEDLPDHEEQVEHRREGHPGRYERRFLRKDGAVVWTLVAGTPLTATDGRFRGSFGLISDITERKRAELGLQLSEERYRSLLAAATDYVFTVPYREGQPQPTIHGPGCVKITGYDPKAYDADPYLWYRMIVAEDRAAVEKHIQQAIAGDAATSIEHRLLHRDGTIRWVRNTLVPRRDLSGRLLALDGLVTDITERTLALQQLREREALYRAVIETSVDGFCIVDAQGRLVEVNDSYVRRSGYSRAELLTMHIADIDAAGDPEAVRVRLGEIRHAGSDLFETRHRTKDGLLWQAEVNVSYWPIGDGRFFVFIRDVRRRRRSETLLRTRAHMAEIGQGGALDPLLQYAIDAAEAASGSSIGFFHFVDSDQKTLTLQTWSTNTLAHHCTAEGKGKHYDTSRAGIWVECIHERQPKIHNDYTRSPHRKGLPDGHAALTRFLTVPIFRRNRVVAIIGVGNKPVDYNNEDIESVREIADVAMDFVQRIHAEQTLRRNEHQLRLIIDSTPALIAYIDTEYRLRLANEAFHRWFGDPPPQVVPRTVAEQFGQPAFAALKPSLDRAYAGETVGLDLETTLRQAGPRYLQGTCTPDRDESGTVRGIIVFINDLTPAKEMEAQLLRSQRLEVVGRLASGIAHDLNNILQPVLMAPRLIRPSITDPEALDLVDTIEGSVRRGADIIRQLLAFGRGTHVKRAPIRLDSLIVELSRILHETLPKNITLRCELPAHPYPVLADSTQIHQVLMNLCVNARDAMPSGGTLLIRLDQVDCEQPEPHAIPPGHPGRFQVVSVVDTGTGIDPEHLPRLFDPFFTTKEVGEGTGLGLPTVLGIVRSHDGFLVVTSTRGGGSTFRVFLPMVDQPAADTIPALPAAPPAAATSRHHVLVVDDEENVRDLIRRTLLRSGYQVSEAANGAEAFVLLAQRERNIDLVIADMLMPVMDGASLVQELHRRRPRLPIMAMSGHVGEPLALSALSPATSTFLPKPFDADQLLGAIDTMFRKLQ